MHACYDVLLVCTLHAGLLNRFDVLDLNDDRRLDADEFSQYFPGASRVFDMLDLDRDGFITRDEIDHMLQRLAAQQGKGTEPTSSDLENGGDAIYTAEDFDNTVGGDNSETDGNF